LLVLADRISGFRSGRIDEPESSLVGVGPAQALNGRCVAVGDRAIRADENEDRYSATSGLKRVHGHSCEINRGILRTGESTGHEARVRGYGNKDQRKRNRTQRMMTAAHTRPSLSGHSASYCRGKRVSISRERRLSRDESWVSHIGE